MKTPQSIWIDEAMSDLRIERSDLYNEDGSENLELWEQVRAKAFELEATDQEEV
jgi:hypothetical protein